ARTAAAVAVLVAELASRPATRGRLADEHARGAVREAGARAALAAARRQLLGRRVVVGAVAAHLTRRRAARRAARRDDTAGTERRAIGLGAQTTAALAVGDACVADLGAEGRCVVT